MPNFRLIAVLLIVCGLLAFAACAGGSDKPDAGDGTVSCEPLARMDAYRFVSRGLLQVKAADVTPTPTADGPLPGSLPFTNVIEAEGMVRENDIAASVRQGEGEGAMSDPADVIRVNDTVYFFVGGVWVQSGGGPGSPVAYTPIDTCNAIAPLLDLSGVNSVEEDVNGVPSLHFALEIPNAFFANHPNFGSSSDAAHAISTISVDVWIVANSNYPIKVNVRGQGTYPNESQLTVEVSYELSDLNGQDIEITPPPSPVFGSN